MMSVATMGNINALFVTLVGHATQFQFSTDLFCLQLAEMPRSPDLAIFMSMTTTTQPITLPLCMRAG